MPGNAARCGCRRTGQHPHGPQIPLLVAVLPAIAATHRAAPLFYLAGWGGSAIGGAQWAMRSFGQLNNSVDLVFAAQPDTEFSWPQTAGLTATAPAARARALRRCLASVNRSPRHDTTAAAARDLDQVRKALGYNKINLFGASYGVSMGLAYLQRYSAHVRTAVFYSGSLLSVPLWQLTPVHAQQAFDQVARRCAAAPACAGHYHPAADLTTVVNRLRAHPARVTITGHSGVKQTITITLVGFLNHVIDDYLSSPDTAVLLPKDLHAIARGQWAKVITARGLASVISSAAAPTQLQDDHRPLRRRLGRDEPRDDSPAEPVLPVHPADGRRGGLAAATVRAVAARRGSVGSGAQQRPGRVRQRRRRPRRPAGQRRGRPANHAKRPAGPHPRRLARGPPSGCIPAQATTFILAGQTANRDAWAACARTLVQRRVSFLEGLRGFQWSAVVGPSVGFGGLVLAEDGEVSIL